MMPLLAQMDPAQVQANANAYRMGQLFAALTIGLLGGLIVKKFADSRGQSVIGWVGFAATLAAGLGFGLLGAVPSGVLFAIVASVMPAPAKKKRGKKPAQARFGPPRTPSQPYEI